MPESNDSPLLEHPLGEPTAFPPEDLIVAVRDQRSIPTGPIPAVCVLDFDGDLVDWLDATAAAKPEPHWACFHTKMHQFDVDGRAAGIIPRTIGGPYAVLIAEQLLSQGARAVIGLTSAGRVDPDLPVPCLVVADAALRDEGTSLHYLPAGRMVSAPQEFADSLASGVGSIGLPVRRAPVWTTDAPYRETESQLRAHAAAGIAAVEMQAASLFALAAVKSAHIGVVAHVTNAAGADESQFDKGHDALSLEIAKAAARAAFQMLEA